MKIIVGRHEFLEIAGLGEYLLQRNGAVQLVHRAVDMTTVADPGHPAVFDGFLTVILIGLIVENPIFRTIERNTVQKWGTQS